LEAMVGGKGENAVGVVARIALRIWSVAMAAPSAFLYAAGNRCHPGVVPQGPQESQPWVCPAVGRTAG
jgi:hypothetical protein